MKKVVDWVTVKFLIVGVINTLVGTSVMFLCYNILHTGYWAASALNYIIGSIVSYFLNKYFIYKTYITYKTLKYIHILENIYVYVCVCVCVCV